jgi:hypothetical protein
MTSCQKTNIQPASDDLIKEAEETDTQNIPTASSRASGRRCMAICNNATGSFLVHAQTGLNFYSQLGRIRVLSGVAWQEIKGVTGIAKDRNCVNTYYVTTGSSTLNNVVNRNSIFKVVVNSSFTTVTTIRIGSLPFADITDLESDPLNPTNYYGLRLNGANYELSGINISNTCGTTALPTIGTLPIIPLPPTVRVGSNNLKGLTFSLLPLTPGTLPERRVHVMSGTISSSATNYGRVWTLGGLVPTSINFGLSTPFSSNTDFGLYYDIINPIGSNEFIVATSGVSPTMYGHLTTAGGAAINYGTLSIFSAPLLNASTVDFSEE